MKKIKLFILFILVVGTIIVPFSSSININYSKAVNNRHDSLYKDLYEEVHKGVVSVYNYRVDNSLTKLSSIGSGFVYAEDENNFYIITNEHVVENNYYCSIVNYKGHEEKVSVLGYDKVADVAVCSVSKLKMNDLKVLEIENNKPNVGDKIFVIGTPKDTSYRNSVNVGIISGVDRLYKDTMFDYLYSRKRLVQIDCAVNNGNSGGPLFDQNGKVIGINDMKIISDNKDNYTEGLNFSLEINESIKCANLIVDAYKNRKEYKDSYRYTILDDYKMSDLIDIPLYLRKEFNICVNLDYGIVLYNVNKESIYNTGTIVISIDDTTIKNCLELIDYINSNIKNTYEIGMYKGKSSELSHEEISIIYKEVN